ncbi:hypothetical protein TNIN_119011 [Trichonephila inaurata madagascariensis]|uniref:Uncharacterized protein n=1 Tax=Trichonephila inaurata madagascariensis TaxID=2747483 RepID=A0A8X6YU96_9ARAC|nr:hypothetical protein TNIN_119011 [Trichonephila inaurata madagascariensis]
MSSLVLSIWLRRFTETLTHVKMTIKSEEKVTEKKSRKVLFPVLCLWSDLTSCNGKPHHCSALSHAATTRRASTVHTPKQIPTKNGFNGMTPAPR